MSKPKYKVEDWVVVKPNIGLYGGMMGRIIKVTPPHFSSNTVTVYTVQFDNRKIDDFVGLDLKTPTSEQSQEYSMRRLEEGFAIADQLFNKDVKEASKKSPVVKDVDWTDFKTAADKEWESFVK
jgi:hypothetical protein